MASGLTETPPVEVGAYDPISQKLAKRLRNEDGTPLYPDYMRKSTYLRSYMFVNACADGLGSLL